MQLTPADRTKLLDLLDKFARGVEQLLQTGLTTASDSTRQVLAVAFQEASRMRLLRLGSTLRIANEELGRFTRNDSAFSAKRLVFFLNRAWLLSRGITRSLQAGDEAEFDRLVTTPAGVPVPRLTLVTLGVGKKVAAGAFVAFEFRLRSIAAADAAGRSLAAGSRLAWSCIFPVNPGVDVPPEGYLHLPQKQKFTGHQFLERRVVTIDDANVAIDAAGTGRISLGDKSRVELGEEFKEWSRFVDWSPEPMLQRLAAHEPGPLDLEVELQEEIVLSDWSLGEPRQRDGSDQTVYPVLCREVEFDAVVSAGIEGEALRRALDELRTKSNRPPLLGLLHYELCRPVLQPLAVIDEEGPRHLMLSDQAIDRKELLRALRLT
jgi:hypothetical protein